ncbi:MAG: sulfatase [Candidatus Aminicenantes bacterium]|nr:sulfatase [Candidatus Aminicenantes bacterium]
MPEKKVVYLLSAMALLLAACGKTPRTDFRLLRFVDLLETKNIVSSPFATGAFDPSNPIYFFEKNRPITDMGSGGNPLGLKRKLAILGMDVNAIIAPPGSLYAFDVDLLENSVLEFGTGIVRGVNSENVRKMLAAGENNVLFLVRLEMSGRNKVIYQASIGLPPMTEERTAKLVPVRVPLPASGGKARISFATEGPAGAFSFWADPVVSRPGRKGRKIVLISVDTLRADHLGCYGYGKDTSPNSDALARDAALFVNTYAPSPWTLPSHVSLLTALSCFRHGVNLESATIDRSRPTLADILRSNGFYCAAVTGGGFVGAVFGFSKGFDLYTQSENSLIDSAAMTFAAAAKWIDENRDKDFFLFIHTYQPHGPYVPPPPYDTMFLDPDPLWTMIDVGNHIGGPKGVFKELPEKERRNIVGLYDGEIRSTDESLVGPLVAKLKSLKVYDETMIVLTSDHGEEFFEHGSWEHGHALYDESLKVPLIIKFPNSKFRGKRVEPFVRLIDVMPTVMDVYGIGDEGFDLDGRSLMPVLKGKEKKDRSALAYLAAGVLSSPIPEKMAITDGRSKIILNRPYGPEALGSFLFPPASYAEVEAFDLAADPRERTNIVSRKASLAGRLVAIMQELQTEGGKPSGEKAEIDAETKKKLRALGYIRCP